MSKPVLVPLYFDPGRDADFDKMLQALTALLGEQADFLPPRPLGSPLGDADAAVFPQLLGEGYRQAERFKAIKIPKLLLTTEFGTLSMWDWELATYLRSEGVKVITPYNLEQTRKVLAALAAQKQLRNTTFLVFQDNPGEGFQAPIFKRFYWWEQECSDRMAAKFGLRIVRKSFKELGAKARRFSDRDAAQAWTDRQLPSEGVTGQPLLAALKLYLALREELENDPSIGGMGLNCLNESHFCDTTPCLAWSLLYAERGLIWGCEADTLSMLTQFILHKSLGCSAMMTNLYPFLLGNAALKHERIAKFPDVDAQPENHILAVHCGYFGLLPRSFATDWTLRPKVLSIVNDNATAVDARLPVGDVTLAKLYPTMDRLSVAEGTLQGYVQFPGSDCLNGGLIKVRDGHKLMAGLISHHYLLLTGHNRVDLGFVADVFGLGLEDL
jgi:hypothetical protein